MIQLSKTGIVLTLVINSLFFSSALKFATNPVAGGPSGLPGNRWTQQRLIRSSKFHEKDEQFYSNMGYSRVESYAVYNPLWSSCHARRSWYSTLLRSATLKNAEKNSDKEKEVVQAKILVKGQVQGGFYRAMAKKEANFHRRLLGAIRELADGSVEIIVEGPKTRIESFIGWCKRGPGLTQMIKSVEVEWAEATGIFESFEIFPLES